MITRSVFLFFENILRAIQSVEQPGNAYIRHGVKQRAHHFFFRISGFERAADVCAHLHIRAAMSAHTGKTAPRRTERVRTVNILSARRCAHERFLRRAVRKGRGGESKGAEGRLRRGRISFDKITQYTLKPLTARTAFNIIILTTRV